MDSTSDRKFNTLQHSACGEPHNRMLALLSERTWAGIGPLLERVPLRRPHLIWPVGVADYAYFPERGLVSVAAKASEREWIDVWLIGSEGMIGVPLVLGGVHRLNLRRQVVVSGTACRISQSDLRCVIAEVPEFRELVLRYVELVLFQTAQLGVCNAHHSLEQRLARLLLMARFSAGADQLPLTHAILARMLGVRRPSVTECLLALQRQGALTNTRGLINVADADVLAHLSCDCHRLILREYRGMLESADHRP